MTSNCDYSNLFPPFAVVVMCAAILTVAQTRLNSFRWLLFKPKTTFSAIKAAIYERCDSGDERAIRGIANNPMLALEKDPRDGNDGRTLLHYAAGRGRSAVIDALLTHGALIEAVAHGGDTPISLACHNGVPTGNNDNGCKDAAIRLVSHGANPHLKDSSNKSALMYARLRWGEEEAQEIEMLYNESLGRVQ